jgi:hypothetical protein
MQLAVRQPIVIGRRLSAGDPGCEDSRTTRKSRLKGGCGQDCPPHKTSAWQGVDSRQTACAVWRLLRAWL